MSETPDAPRDRPIPVARPISRQIPVARPIGLHEAAAGLAPGGAILLESHSRARAWADVGLLIVCLALCELFLQSTLGVAAALLPEPEQLEPDQLDAYLQRTLFVPLITLRAVGWLIVVASFVYVRRQTPASVGLARRGWGVNVLLGVVSAGVAFGLGMFVNLLLWLLWSEVRDQMVQNAERIMELVPRLHPLTFAGLSFLVGVYEEVVFRGFMMTRLRRATGSWILAVLISTTVFTALHAVEQTPAALVWVTILSFVFSGVTIWRRSIVPAIVGHMLFDLAQFLFLSVQAGDTWT